MNADLAEPLLGFDALKDAKYQYIPRPKETLIMLEDFRQSPNTCPLNTPSGKTEVFSETIAEFSLDDCRGYPNWFEPRELLGGDTIRHRLHLLSNQPKTKLHSQLDHGSVSRLAKIAGCEPVAMHPEAAAARGLKSGDFVKVHNVRGSRICGLVVSAEVMANVIQLSTGAWYDPEYEATDKKVDDQLICKHGNPNVLTVDRGTSSLAQGPVAHSCLVEVSLFTGVLPEVSAHIPPMIADRT